MGINVYVFRETNCYAGYLIRDQRLSGKSLKGLKKSEGREKSGREKGRNIPLAVVHRDAALSTVKSGKSG
jgi:hypothetical protein